jgi:hypothetical protein
MLFSLAFFFLSAFVDEEEGLMTNSAHGKCVAAHSANSPFILAVVRSPLHRFCYIASMLMLQSPKLNE